MDYAEKFTEGLGYNDFLQKYGNAEQQRRWENFHGEVHLTEAQQDLLNSFTRNMKVIVFAGAWCGDCVNQCPIFDHFAAQNENIEVRYFDRDDNPDLAERLTICGGNRVPVVLFLSEDGQQTGMYGDRTISKYRDVAGSLDGATCPTGLVAPDQSLTQQVVQDWLNEFERIQLILRTSGRLRELHGD